MNLREDIRMKTRIAAVILIISCLFSFCSCETEPVIEKSASIYAVNQYLLEIVGIDFTRYTAETEMEVEKKNGAEFAYIKIHQTYNVSSEVTALLKKETNVDDAPFIRIPAYKNHRFANEMLEMEITGHYITVKTGGSLTESRHIDIYTAFKGEGEGKDYYIFIFG